MTGICGIWRRDGLDAREDCARMRRALKIYGPHREGQWDGGGISFGIQLFKMLPEDCFDRQPLSGGSGRFVLVADVRLDNRPELAAELGWSTERTRDAADADYVLAAWERWQDGALDKLIGEWALAVWDADKRTVTLACDMLGQRPLFFHQGKDFFAFATMAKGLHALPDIPVAPDLVCLRDYLALAPMRGPGSFFNDVLRVEAGGKVVLSAGGGVEAAHWYDWSRIAERPVTDDAACIEEFRGLFDRAVSDCLRTDGRIGSELSGGYDSTAVTVTAARLLAAKGKRLTAFTHVPTKGYEWERPKGRLADEGPLAAATAAAFPNIDHVLVDSGERQIGEGLEASFYYSEYPALNLCNQVWIDEIQRRARGHAVLLSGQRGNMTISLNGFERLHGLVRQGQWLTWMHEAADLYRRRRAGPLGILNHTFGPWLPRSWHAVIQQALGRRALDLPLYSALHPAIAGDRDFCRHLESLGCDPTFRPHASIRQVARFVLLRGGFLGQAAKGTLARSAVARRDPTADRRLIEFSLSLPERMWLRGGETRWLYRQAFRGLVPEAVMNLKGKGYQGADWPERLKRSKTLLDAEIAVALANPDLAALVDTGFLAFCRNGGLSALSGTAENTYTYRIKMLRCLSVTHFIRKSGRTNAPPPE